MKRGDIIELIEDTTFYKKVRRLILLVDQILILIKLKLFGLVKNRLIKMAI